MRRIFLSIFLSFFCAFNFFPQTSKNVDLSEISEEIPVPQGRIIVLVVDVSQSIKKQLGTIIDGLSSEIVDKRLRSGDYCVVIPLGDKSVVEKADSFSVRYSRDKQKIRDYLSKIGTWSNANLNTDIGAAMQKTFDFISMIENESAGEMYEPLVLFITDGEIYESPNSSEKVLLKNPDAIFSDPKTSPAQNSYANWWFLGIENEGVPLEHIRQIADGAGAIDRYEPLSDMEQFGVLFDLWLSSIPDPLPRDKGGVLFSDFSFGGVSLGEKTVNVPNNAKKIDWTIKNSFERTNVVLKLKDVRAIFQDEKTGKVVDLNVNAEAGGIEIAPNATRKTSAVANVKRDFENVKGRLKFSFVVESNGGIVKEIPECSFFVSFKSPFVIFAQKVAVPVCIFFAIILVIVLILILKSRKSVKIQMEIVGKSRSLRAINVRVGRKIVIGSKPNADFKLESNFPNEVAIFERTGASSFKIVVRDEKSLSQNDLNALKNYKIGSPVKVLSRDGAQITLKFRKKR